MPKETAEQVTNASEVQTVDEIKAQLRAEVVAEVKAEYDDKLEQAKMDLKSESETKTEDALAKSENEFAAQDKSVKAWLDAQEKVDIEIPEDPNNPGDVVPVGYNGVIYAIPRGQVFKVPRSIYDVWKYSHEETKKVNRRVVESVTKEVKIID